MPTLSVATDDDRSDPSNTCHTLYSVTKCNDKLVHSGEYYGTWLYLYITVGKETAGTKFLACCVLP